MVIPAWSDSSDFSPLLCQKNVQLIVMLVEELVFDEEVLYWVQYDKY